MDTKKFDLSLKAVLFVIAIGIWAIVLQNAGIIPTSQNVEVTNRVSVTGDVDVSGSVNVNNTVDINVSEVNGRAAKSYSNGLLGVSCQ